MHIARTEAMRRWNERSRGALHNLAQQTKSRDTMSRRSSFFGLDQSDKLLLFRRLLFPTRMTDLLDWILTPGESHIAFP
jgi:hypothetical protein